MPPAAKKRRSGPRSFARATTPAIARVPNLAELPYQILLSILQYASHEPQMLHCWPNSRFLLNCATLSRTFKDPAITALYSHPPTLSPQRAHLLLQALRDKPELGWKVKTLAIEIDPVLNKKTPGYGYFDVAELVFLSKGLRELWIAHTADRPPYRFRERVGAWRYPERLWDVLAGRPLKKLDSDTGLEMETENASTGVEDDADIWLSKQPFKPVVLRSFRWNGQFLGIPKAELEQIYRLPSFQTLRSLSLIYVDQSDNDEFPEEYEEELAHLISLLPELNSLTLETCGVASPTFLRLLAQSAPQLRLQNLTFTNCPNLESAPLAAFLASPTCFQLQSLTVTHNRALSLTFLSSLSFCPSLQSLDFDGNYYSASAMHHDARPDYEELLPPALSWHLPETLQSLRLVNLRKWSSDAAMDFLQQLWEHRGRLPRLRLLVLHAILDDFGWRERAHMRDVWVPRLRRAYARASPPPLTAEQFARRIRSPTPARETDCSPPRRSGRIARSRSEEELRKRVEEGGWEGDHDGVGVVEPEMCVVKLDNSRPVEQPFDEGDFVEDERSERRRRAGSAAGGGADRAGASSSRSGAARGRARGKKGGVRKSARKKVKVTTVVVDDSGDEEYQD